MAKSKQGDHDSGPQAESADSQYSPEYLREVASGDARQKRLDELHRGWLRGLRRNANIRVNERLLESLL